VKFDFGESLVEIVDSAGEIEPSMAVKAFQPFAEEQRFAAFGRWADGVWVVANSISIIR